MEYIGVVSGHIVVFVVRLGILLLCVENIVVVCGEYCCCVWTYCCCACVDILLLRIVVVRGVYC